MRLRFVPAVWRGLAVGYALVIVVISLLPGARLEAWLPIAMDHGLDPALSSAVIELAALAGLLALLLPVALRVLRMRIRVARLRLSRPLSLMLVLGIAAFALIASDELRAWVWDLVTVLLPAALGVAVDRLSAGHVMAYGGLGVLMALGWGRERGPWQLGLLGLALSGVLEVMQDVVPGRAANPWDLLSNALGLALGLIAGQLLLRRVGRRASEGAPRRRRRDRSLRPALASQAPAATHRARQHRKRSSGRHALRQPPLGRRRRDDDRN